MVVVDSGGWLSPRTADFGMHLGTYSDTSRYRPCRALPLVYDVSHVLRRDVSITAQSRQPPQMRATPR